MHDASLLISISTIVVVCDCGTNRRKPLVSSDIDSSLVSAPFTLMWIRWVCWPVARVSDHPMFFLYCQQRVFQISCSTSVLSRTRVFTSFSSPDRHGPISADISSTRPLLKRSPPVTHPADFYRSTIEHQREFVDKVTSMHGRMSGRCVASTLGNLHGILLDVVSPF